MIKLYCYHIILVLSEKCISMTVLLSLPIKQSSLGPEASHSPGILLQNQSSVEKLVTTSEEAILSWIQRLAPFSLSWE